MGQIENCLDEILDVLKEGGGGGGGTIVVPLSVTENGTYTAPSGTAYSPVNVNVPQTEIEAKNITSNGTYTAESGKAFSPVTVAVPVPTLETKSVTSNGNYDAPSGKAYNRVEVNVPSTNELFAQLVMRGSPLTAVKSSDFDGYDGGMLRDYAFSYCTNLESVELPASTKFLNQASFLNCTALTTINLDNVVRIESSAFMYCRSLSAITLSNQISYIGSSAFSQCSNLVSVTIPNNTPPTLGGAPFTNTHADLVIYVPAESVEAYKTASGWSTYASKIQAIPNS